MSARVQADGIPHENVDAAEIDKFEELASRWWDPESEFKPLHLINPLRLGFINARTPLRGLRVVDVGCGGGILSEAMALAGASVTGIDMGEAPLKVARAHAMESGAELEYRKMTAEALAESDAGAYDVVTCMEMLEHVPDPASVVSACAALVKPGGSAYFSTINRNPKSFLFAILGAEYVFRILPRGTHQYERLIRPSELYGWCEQAGIRITELTGIHYNPLLQQYRLAPGVDVNYIAHAVDG